MIKQKTKECYLAQLSHFVQGLVRIDAVAGIAQEFGLQGLGQGGVAGGEIFVGRLKIVPPAAEIISNEAAAADLGVVPGAGAEAVNADAFVHVVR